MKIINVNQNGQIVIPAKFKKNLNIDESTLLEIFMDISNRTVCIRPHENNQKHSTTIKFKKKKDFTSFHFDSKNSEEDDLGGKVDEILYKN